MAVPAIPLRREHCVVCHAGDTAIDPEAPGMAAVLREIPGWSVVRAGPEPGNPALERTYSFSGFRDALAFAVEVGCLAESEDHHPELVVSWGSVRVRWWTHAVKGLHRNDLVMAAKTDAVRGMDDEAPPAL